MPRLNEVECCQKCGSLTQVMYSETSIDGEWVRLCWKCKNGTNPKGSDDIPIINLTK